MDNQSTRSTFKRRLAETIKEIEERFRAEGVSDLEIAGAFLAAAQVIYEKQFDRAELHILYTRLRDNIVAPADA